MATNLALQLQVIEPDTDLNSIMIGNSKYSDDVWDLRPFVKAKTINESKKYIRFEYISDADMKETVWFPFRHLCRFFSVHYIIWQ